jgi:hypothetical protein
MMATRCHFPEDDNHQYYSELRVIIQNINTKMLRGGLCFAMNDADRIAVISFE